MDHVSSRERAAVPGALARKAAGWILAAATLSSSACGGGGGSSPTPAPAPPVVQQFVATPASIQAGQASVLSWSVSGATSLRLGPGVGDVSGHSSSSVNPGTTTTYTLTASNAAGSTTATATVTVNPAADPFAAVTAAIQAAQGQFPGGLTVEILTPQGVVYSQSWGGFTNQTYAAVASASKWVSGTVILSLVDQGVLSLDQKAKTLLKDRSGQPWSGNMGEITLRDLLSFTSGIPGDLASADGADITLEEAVLRIYEAFDASAAAPNSSFYYGSTHLRIAARMAEVATGKSWRALFDQALRVPLGWGVTSSYGNGTNPDPAGSLACTGQEYVRFLMLQLRRGMYGGSRMLSDAIIGQQRTDGFGPATTIAFSPYAAMGRVNHYGCCNWLEAANGQAPGPSNPVQRVSSTGKFGWAPWVEVGGGQDWAAVIMCQLPDSGVLIFAPSESLKLALAPLVPAALAQNPPVLRTVP